MKTRIVLIAGAAAAVAAAGPASALVASPSLGLAGGKAAADSSGKKDNAEQVPSQCSTDGHSLLYTGPTTMWPPNHKYRDVKIEAFGHPDDTVGIMVESTHDEMLPDGTEMNGAGNTAEDVTQVGGIASGQGHAQWDGKVRGERSGRGDGRTYSFKVTATFSDEPGQTCTHTFTATVPHDQGQGGGKAPRKSAKKRAAARR